MLPVSDSGKYSDGVETFLDSSHSVVCIFIIDAKYE